jgi:hypothetical protein
MESLGPEVDWKDDDRVSVLYGPFQNRVSQRSVYTNSDFQCRMRQLHLTPHKKLGLILFFVRCQMRLSHPTLKITFM